MGLTYFLGVVTAPTSEAHTQRKVGSGSSLHPELSMRLEQCLETESSIQHTLGGGRAQG